MRLLFIVPYTPTHIRTRPRNILRALRGRGHEITLLTLTGGQEDEGAVETLRAEGLTVFAEPLTRGRALTNSLAALPTSDPLQAHYCWQPVLARRLERRLADQSVRYAAVHVEHLRGARYALNARDHAAARGIPVVWDSVDCITHLFRQAADRSASRAGRWMSRLELSRTAAYEGWLASRFDAALVTSEVDRRELTSLAASLGPLTTPIHVIPNGVDLDYFRPSPATPRDSATLVLTGKMSYHANVTMAMHLVREVMPLVWARRPETGVVIAGKDPVPEVVALQQDGRVEVTGEVADLRPYLWRGTIAIAPTTYGAGIQNKVLEAMACGTPVVASRQASMAMSAVEGRDFLVGETADELAGAVLCLLEDNPRRVRLGAAGRSYVEARHDWNHIAAMLESVYEAAAAQLTSSTGRVLPSV